MALSEHDLIRRYFRPLTGKQGIGLADDAALLEPEPSQDLVISTDLIAEGVHFFSDDPAEAIAAKAIRVNLSDLYAKGAEPVCYLLNLGLGDNWSEEWVARFAEGLRRDQERYGIVLAGGDTSRTKGSTIVAITAIGRVPRGTMVARSGAKPGDVIVVSGTIGDAALGLRDRAGGRFRVEGAETDLVNRFLYPEPRDKAAPLIRQHATAAMDVSDGLVGDLVKLAAASSLGAVVEVEKVPLSSTALHAIKTESDLLHTALTGGDDYEILATVPSSSVEGFVRAADSASVRFTPIGRMVSDRAGPIFLDEDGETMEFARVAYDHLARTSG